MSRKRRDAASVTRRQLTAQSHLSAASTPPLPPAAILRVVEDPTLVAPDPRPGTRVVITSSVEGVEALGRYHDDQLILVAVLPFVNRNDNTLWMHLAKNGDSYRHRVRVELEGDINWAEKVEEFLAPANYDVAVFEYVPLETGQAELGNAG